MIKIYLFVTGMVLFVAPPDEAPDVVRAILASGGRDVAGLGTVRSHGGRFEVIPGTRIPLEPLTWLVIEKPCPLAGCRGPTTLANPDRLPRLAELSGRSVVKPECLDPSRLSQCVDGNGAAAASALVEIRGSWTARPLTDCIGALPHELEETVKIGFVNAHNATRSLFPVPQARALANSLRFETEVATLGEITIVLAGKPQALTLAPRELCEEQPGFPAHDPEAKCALIAVRHGDTATTPPRYQPGNLHFATLYDLLDPPPETLWLPYKVAGEACGGGGGTSGLQLCIGGLIGDWISP